MAKKPPDDDKDDDKAAEKAAEKAARKARKKRTIREILGRRMDRILARQEAGPLPPSHERLLSRLAEKREKL